MPVTSKSSRLASRGAIAVVALGTLVSAGVVAGSSASAVAAPELRIGDSGVPEGNPGTTSPTELRLRLSEPLAADLYVHYAAFGGPAVNGADGDYKLKPGTVKIAAGKVVGTIAPQINGDAEVEADETFGVMITGTSDPSVTVARPSGTVTILSDDPSSGSTDLRIGDVTIPEGDALPGTAAQFGLGLSAPLAADLDVAYLVVPGTATRWIRDVAENGDVKPGGGTARIRAGRTTGLISVTGMPDTTDEGDEQFTVVITGTSDPAVNVARSTGTGTILDDDALAASVPDVATGLTATPGAIFGTVDLSWVAPFDGGSPITNYTIERTLDGGATWVPTGVGVGTTATVQCGFSGDTCAFRLLANNDVGTGAASAPSNSVTVPVATVPGTPTNVSVTANAAQSYLDVSWTPASDGGSPITGYLVEFKPDGSFWQSEGVHTGTSVTVCCYFAPWSYELRVTAINAVGFGAPSATASIELQLVAPANVVATVVGPGTVEVTWDESTGTWPADFYDLLWSTDGGVNYFLLDYAGTTSHTVSGLAGAGTITFKVMGETSGGSVSPLSAASNAVTV